MPIVECRLVSYDCILDAVGTDTFKAFKLKYLQELDLQSARESVWFWETDVRIRTPGIFAASQVSGLR